LLVTELRDEADEDEDEDEDDDAANPRTPE
jgi:hypothetical protein